MSVRASLIRVVIDDALRSPSIAEVEDAWHVSTRSAAVAVVRDPGRLCGERRAFAPQGGVEGGGWSAEFASPLGRVLAQPPLAEVGEQPEGAHDLEADGEHQESRPRPVMWATSHGEVLAEETGQEAQW